MSERVRLVELERGRLRVREWHVDAGAETSCGLRIPTGVLVTKWVDDGAADYAAACPRCRAARRQGLN